MGLQIINPPAPSIFSLGTAGKLQIDGATAGSYFDYSASVLGTSVELMLHGSRAFYNILGLQNDDDQGYSAIIARDNTGRERSAWGFGNLNSSGNFAGRSYWEGWNGQPFQQSIDPPTGQRIVQTGYNTYFDPATSSASTIAGTVLTVGGSLTGTFKVNQTLAGSGITPGTRIVSLGTGAGGAGTYNISASHTIAVAQAINAAGQDTQEVRIDITPDGFINFGAWAQHGVTGVQINPQGSVSLVAGANLTLASGTLTVGGNISGATLFVSANINMANGSVLNWGANRGAQRSPADGSFRFSNSANNSFTSLLFATGASTNVGIYPCTGTPEGAVTAAVGSIAFRLDGGAGTTLYVKESGTGNTGWAAK